MPARSAPLFAVPLLFAAVGCGLGLGEPKGPGSGGSAAAPVAPAADAVARPAPEPDRPPPAEPPPPIPGGYAAGLRARLSRGEAAAVRESLPDGAVAAVGAFRRALVRADPEQRATALAALATLAELTERQHDFLAASRAAGQGDEAGIDAPGWVGPLLRAIAAGPASDADPAALTDAALIDGTVAVLLADPVFRRGLQDWVVKEDMPSVPPAAPVTDAADGGDDGIEEVTGRVVLSAPGRGDVTVPVVASGGKWVPVVVEATAPSWAARADSAGGTGAAAVLAAAGPHLEAALAADTQEAFDDALRAATTAAVATFADPPAPVPDDAKVTLDLTRPLTARQVADLLPVLEAATDDPTRAVSRAAPRANEPGWRLTVGPVKDPAAWLARLPALTGAAVEGRTVTLAYEPPPPAPADEAVRTDDAAEVEGGDRRAAD